VCQDASIAEQEFLKNASPLVLLSHALSMLRALVVA